MQVKKTPLYDMHIELGGKMVEFAGFMMPMQYKGIVAEHNAVRQSCGIFDVSHMGEIEISGEYSLKALQILTTNDISQMEQGQIKYTLMCSENGGIVDDLLVYKLTDNKYCLIVNASNTSKDYKFMKDNNKYNVTIKDKSNDIAQIALQGPKSVEILKGIIKVLPDKYYTFIQSSIFDIDCIISRTGYTGEDGFEIYCPSESAAVIWQKIITAGGNDIMPCGLGCRDTLRFEASMPLYGYEMTEDITPIEASLKYFVKMNDENDFIGKNAIKLQLEKGLERRRCGIEILDRVIERHGAEVFGGDKKVGYVTSGTKAITLGKMLAMAIVIRLYNKIGTELSIEVRGKKLASKVIKMPFYKRAK